MYLLSQHRRYGRIFGVLGVYWSLLAASWASYGALGKNCETAITHCETAVKHRMFASLGAFLRLVWGELRGDLRGS
jgi:hypothetical protein